MIVDDYLKILRKMKQLKIKVADLPLEEAKSLLALHQASLSEIGTKRKQRKRAEKCDTHGSSSSLP